MKEDEHIFFLSYIMLKHSNIKKNLPVRIHSSHYKPHPKELNYFGCQIYVCKKMNISSSLIIRISHIYGLKRT